MTQGTIVIANGAGAAVRAAINTSNESQATKQSGSSAPSPTYPFMDWADTANDLLKQRNAANSAWIIKSTLSAEYGGLPANSITYDPGSPAIIEASTVQAAIDELAGRSTAGAWDLITSASPSGVSNYDLTGFNPTLYSDYRILVEHATFSNDVVTLSLRTSTDGGSTYVSSAAAYSWNNLISSSATATGNGNNSTTQIDLVTSVSNSANGGIGRLQIDINQPDLTARCSMNWVADVLLTGASSHALFVGQGRRLAAEDVNAVRLLTSAGTFSGTVRMFGLTR